MVKIEVLSGSKSIGGNFIRITDGDKRIVFDHGMRFDLFKRYYSRLVTPSGIGEMRDLEILPKEDWYDGVSDIYITHLHFDHLGLLSNIPRELTVHLPSESIYEEMEKRWESSPSWLSLVPRRYYVKVEGVYPLQLDRNNVMPIPVSHSAFPSFAYLYFGSDETVLYTGDFRVESFLDREEFVRVGGGEGMLDYLEDNRDVRVDVLIIEGTNFGFSRVPIAPSDCSRIISKVMSSVRGVVATTHYLDLEFVGALVRTAVEHRFRPFVASERLATVLNTVGFSEGGQIRAISDFVSALVGFETVLLEEALEDKFLLLTSYYDIVDIIRSVRNYGGRLTDLAAIISEPEPPGEELVEYDVIVRWLQLFDLQPYRIRASGHYYPYELKTILDIIQPKKVIPVHTERPEMLYALATGSDVM